MPQPHSQQLLGQPIIAGMVYPAVFVTRRAFERIDLPPDYRYCFVMRDLRDTLVSWYFSKRYSHPAMFDETDRRRAELEARSVGDGLRHGMHTFLRIAARFQRSWINSDAPVFRYEDLMSNPEAGFAAILKHCGIAVSAPALRAILKAASFEQSSGRERGRRMCIRIGASGHRAIGAIICVGRYWRSSRNISTMC